MFENSKTTERFIWRHWLLNVHEYRYSNLEPTKKTKMSQILCVSQWSYRISVFSDITKIHCIYDNSSSGFIRVYMYLCLNQAQIKHDLQRNTHCDLTTNMQTCGACVWVHPLFESRLCKPFKKVIITTGSRQSMPTCLIFLSIITVLIGKIFSCHHLEVHGDA